MCVCVCVCEMLPGEYNQQTFVRKMTNQLYLL